MVKTLHKNNRGFSLIELSIVIMISLMAVTWTMWSKVNTLREANAKTQAGALVTLSNAVSTYMTNNYTNLVNNTAIGGFANIYVPTIPELIASGLLGNNFSANNFYGSTYGIRLSLVPAACVAPNCDVESLVYLTTPITDYRTTQIDGPTLGAAVTTIGANGGFSTRLAPAVIAGTSGGWSVANPVLVAGVAQPGILAIRGGYGSSGWAQFLRRDGSLPMTGALNMGNQNINSAATVNSTTIANSGAINTATLVSSAAVTVGTNLSVAGTTATNGITNTGSITSGTLTSTGTTTVGGALGVTGTSTLGGTLSVAGTTTTNGITNTGNITTNGNLTATGDLTASRLLPTTVVANGQSCIGYDGYQARTSAGSLASCVNGAWTTPNATTTVVPCAAQTVSWSGCSTNIGAMAAGTTSTVSPSTPSGATGSATFICTAGAQLLQPGSTCTLPPCSAQTLYWGGACSAYFPATSIGSSSTQSATAGGTGTATASCLTGGSSGWNTPSGSCTPTPAGCSATYQGWSGAASGCGGYTSAAASGTSQGISNTNPNRDGSATASCSYGSWSTSGSCTRKLITTIPPYANYFYGGTWYYNAAYLGYMQNIGNIYCGRYGGGWSAKMGSSGSRWITANICNVGLDGAYPSFSCNSGVSGSYFTGQIFDTIACEAP